MNKCWVLHKVLKKTENLDTKLFPQQSSSEQSGAEIYSTHHYIHLNNNNFSSSGHTSPPTLRMPNIFLWPIIINTHHITSVRISDRQLNTTYLLKASISAIGIGE